MRRRATLPASDIPHPASPARIHPNKIRKYQVLSKDLGEILVENLLGSSALSIEEKCVLDVLNPDVPSS